MESSHKIFWSAMVFRFVKKHPYVQASPHPLLIAFRNPAGDLLDLVKKYRAKSAGDTAVYGRNNPHQNSSRQTALSFPGKPRSLICNEKIT